MIYLLGFIAILLTTLAYTAKRTTLGISSAFAWLLLALHSYSLSTAVWDIYYGLFFFGIAMMLAIVVESFTMRKSSPMMNEEKLGFERKTEEQTYTHPADRIRAKHGLPPSIAREKRDIDRKTGWK